MGFYEKAMNSLEDFKSQNDTKYESAEQKILKDGHNVFRLKGDFCECARYWFVGVKDGKEKSLPFVVAQKQKNDEWIKSPLLEMLTGGSLSAREKNYAGGLFEYRLVGEYGSRKREYIHKDTEVFQFFASGGNISEYNETQLNIRPPAFEIVVNCIDREDEQWHIENNKCKMLCKSGSSLGLNGTIWEFIKNVMTDYGDALDYDLTIKKIGEGTNTQYTVQKATPDLIAISEFVREGAITEKEAQYEEYDVYEVSKISSANYILKYFEERVKQVDGVLGTNYYEQLKEEQSISNENEVVEETVKEIKRTPKRVVKEDKKELDFSNEQTEPCDECGKEFPLNMDKCPFCGKEYTVED